jgi:hypothetical protein
MIESLPKLAPLVLRHLAAYLELTAEEVAALVRDLTQRVLAVAMALVAGIVALLLGCLWVTALAWDTPWRGMVIGSLVVLFGLTAAILGARATRGWKPGQRPFARLRTEWESDQLLLQDAFAPASADTQLQPLPRRRVPEP